MSYNYDIWTRVKEAHEQRQGGRSKGWSVLADAANAKRKGGYTAQPVPFLEGKPFFALRENLPAFAATPAFAGRRHGSATTMIGGKLSSLRRGGRIRRGAGFMDFLKGLWKPIKEVLQPVSVEAGKAFSGGLASIISHMKHPGNDPATVAHRDSLNYRLKHTLDGAIFKPLRETGFDIGDAMFGGSREEVDKIGLDNMEDEGVSFRDVKDTVTGIADKVDKKKIADHWVPAWEQMFAGNIVFADKEEEKRFREEKRKESRKRAWNDDEWQKKAVKNKEYMVRLKEKDEELWARIVERHGSAEQKAELASVGQLVSAKPTRRSNTSPTLKDVQDPLFVDVDDELARKVSKGGPSPPSRGKADVIESQRQHKATDGALSSKEANEVLDAIRESGREPIASVGVEVEERPDPVKPPPRAAASQRSVTDPDSLLGRIQKARDKLKTKERQQPLAPAPRTFDDEIRDELQNRRADIEPDSDDDDDAEWEVSGSGTRRGGCGKCKNVVSAKPTLVGRQGRGCVKHGAAIRLASGRDDASRRKGSAIRLASGRGTGARQKLQKLLSESPAIARAQRRGKKIGRGIRLA